MCHLIFFLPVFALPVFWLFPFSTAVLIYLIICAISFFVYVKISGFDWGMRVLVEEIAPKANAKNLFQ